jgi:16S rRNA C1402 (ribose-2'-O) methylase RsmI
MANKSKRARLIRALRRGGQARTAAGLYLVATPIGNLGDITLRALELLAGVDVIACEDTRVTRKLTERYGLATPLTPYHEHNAAEARPKLLARLADGEAVALVSDAGTPLISDPGYKLVRAACEAGHAVTALPGASAVLAACQSRDCRPTVLLRGLPAAQASGASKAHRRAANIRQPGHVRAGRGSQLPRRSCRVSDRDPPRSAAS